MKNPNWTFGMSIRNPSGWMRIMLRTPLVVLSASSFRKSGETTKFGE